MNKTETNHSDLEKEAIRRVMTAAHEDLVSYAEFKQVLKDLESECLASPINERNVIAALFELGIEIGHAVNVAGRFVRFVAWRGASNEKLIRLSKTLDENGEQKTMFMLWLCLAEKVDCFE